MCTPLMAVAMGAQALGSVIQSREANKNAKRAVDARNDAFEVEQMRQRRLQDESGAEFGSAVGRFDPTAQRKQMGETREARTETLTDAVPEMAAGGSGVPIQGSAPTVVGGEIARAMQSAQAGARGSAGRLGKLGAYSDSLFNDNMALNRTRQNIGTVSNFAGRSAGLLPFEASIAAANSQKPSSGFGELLQLVGSGASMAGMMGANPFGAGGPQVLGVGGAPSAKAGTFFPMGAGGGSGFGFGGIY